VNPCSSGSRNLHSFGKLNHLFSLPSPTAALQLIIGSILVPAMVRFLAREKERLASLDESSVSDEESGIGIEAPPRGRGRPKRGDDDDDDDDEEDSGSQGGSDTDQAGSVVKEGEDAATAKSYSASECSSP
jgi:hypothetical protein